MDVGYDYIVVQAEHLEWLDMIAAYEDLMAEWDIDP